MLVGNSFFFGYPEEFWIFWFFSEFFDSEFFDFLRVPRRILAFAAFAILCNGNVAKQLGSTGLVIDSSPEIQCTLFEQTECYINRLCHSMCIWWRNCIWLFDCLCRAGFTISTRAHTCGRAYTAWTACGACTGDAVMWHRTTQWPGYCPHSSPPRAWWGSTPPTCSEYICFSHFDLHYLFFYNTNKNTMYT